MYSLNATGFYVVDKTLKYFSKITLEVRDRKTFDELAKQTFFSYHASLQIIPSFKSIWPVVLFCVSTSLTGKNEKEESSLLENRTNDHIDRTVTEILKGVVS